ncbi:MAG: hypothetical protein R6T91_01560 [Bacteroidales bacterium]
MKKQTYHKVYWVVMIPLLITLLSFVARSNKKMQCQNFEVELHNATGNDLITVQDIKTQVLQKTDTLAGQNIKDIREDLIEAEIERNAYVKKAEVYSTIDGKVVAEVIQHEPVIYLVGQEGQRVYLAIDGFIMPDNPSSPLRLPVGTGMFSLVHLEPQLHDYHVDSLKDRRLKEFQYIGKTIYQDALFRAAVEQVYLNEEGEYEMITKLGHHSVLLGDTTRLKEKLKKLEVFYQNAQSRGGWDRYKRLNLKYKHQVIGEKK